MSSDLPQKDVFFEVPVFDYEKALNRVHQKKDLLKRVIEIFVNSLSERTDIIANEINNENWEQLGTMAHSIKGSSWTIGAQQLGDIAYAMEKAAVNKNMPLFHHLFQIFKESVQRFFEYEKEINI
jgi:HPt (histidine-containing phosphotransfer) domain-containing protein